MIVIRADKTPQSRDETPPSRPQRADVSWVGARIRYPSTERDICRAIYGGVPFFSVSVDLRNSRCARDGATNWPVKVDATNSFGAFRKALRSLFPRFQSLQEPKRGISQTLKTFLRLLIHAVKHGASNVGKIRFSLGVPRNV